MGVDAGTSNPVFKKGNLSKIWLAIKALEDDKSAIEFIKQNSPNIEEKIKKYKNSFEEKYNKKIALFLATFRYDSAEIIFSKFVKEEKKGKLTFTQKADKIILDF